MGAIKLIDKEIAEYMALLSVQQKEVVLSVVKSFAREEAWWNDKVYIAEMDRRFSELESGSVKGITLEQLESDARQSYKNSNNGNNDSHLIYYEMMQNKNKC